MAYDPARHRYRYDVGDRPYASRREPSRSKVPRSVLRRIHAVRTLSARRNRWPAQNTGVGGNHHQDRRALHGRIGAANGVVADTDRNELVRPARRPWRTARVDDGDVGGHVWSDWEARLRLRAGLR